MNATPHLPETVIPDEDLVARTRDGDCEAFRRIVERYQALICSIAYSATGSLAHSEDLAQETFVAGWKQMAQLREPAKLRPWLCGIARNLIHNHRRQLASRPANADDPALIAEAASPEPLPSETVMKREQEAILWRALENVPEAYRQPLILFYREHQSVESVARDLDLSEEAVRQRLSRGRKLLHHEVTAFVEETLAHTAPGPVFTTGVMAALPLLAGAGIASASMSGGIAAQAGAVAPAAKLLAAFNFVLGPVAALLAAGLGVREAIMETRSAEERRLVKRHFLLIAGASVAFTLASIPLNGWAKAGGGFNAAPMLLWLALLLAYVAGVAALAFRLQRKQQRMRRDGIERAGLAPAREYRSRWTIFGLPLLHVRLEGTGDGAARPALGWIAIGNYAVGILFAWGGVAVGAVSGGGLSVGLVSISALSVGFLAVGGLAIGVYALGGVALGMVATGAFAFGWIGAEGRYAIARTFALGLHAAAAHANDDAARQFFSDHAWLDFRATAGRAVAGLVWVPALLAVGYHLARRRVLRARRQNDS